MNSDRPGNAGQDANLVETRIDGETLHDEGFLILKRDRVTLPDGKVTTREYLEHPGAVMILPVFDDGRVLVERQFRYPVHQVMIEYPAGKLDKGEDPLVCAKRELEEETGYRASDWRYLTRIHPVISYSTETLDLYLATGLTAGERRLDEGEFLDLEIVTLEQMLAWVHDGTISDVKTIISTMWLDRLKRGDWPQPPLLP
ncbi:NUDIX domain-containing protein [Chitinasiproducens palmae]|uniref:GDP-mannose pyrophosphatase n=1 Tax=Chitinasiproducens palmae TaxID=1770053 RepID=A0A1H2PSJ3_9BURK|nr:NUDIX hydrolase [Chitinasiproducens palmae]SDV49993.1 ADP-ribose pyrophosphatase [Chitinasiproducens palmae]